MPHANVGSSVTVSGACTPALTSFFPQKLNNNSKRASEYHKCHFIFHLQTHDRWLQCCQEQWLSWTNCKIWSWNIQYHRDSASVKIAYRGCTIKLKIKLNVSYYMQTELLSLQIMQSNVMYNWSLHNSDLSLFWQWLANEELCSSDTYFERRTHRSKSWHSFEGGLRGVEYIWQKSCTCKR